MNIENGKNSQDQRDIFKQEKLSSPEQYWNDPRVTSSVLSFLGGEGDSWSNADSISPAFLGISTERKLYSGRRSPVTTIPPTQMESKIREEKGNFELNFSLLQKESRENPGFPRRVIFCWDIDRYRLMPDDTTETASFLENPENLFGSLGTTYDIYKQTFDSLGLPVMAVVSGKGYHFFTQITDPEIISLLQKIGGPVEDTVAGKLSANYSTGKNYDSVPLFHEQAYKGSVRLQQWVNTMTIEKIRQNTPLSVEIWSKGPPGAYTEGIALDNTSALYTVNTRIMSALGSPYFLKGKKSGLLMERMIIQLPIKGNGYSSTWGDIANTRYKFEAAAEYLSSVDCHIPDASGNMEIMINSYLQSDLRSLHEAMDRTMGDPPETFYSGYRANDYEAIIGKTHEPDVVRNIINNAHTLALRPFQADKLIFEIFEALGGSRDNPEPAPHVAGFLRSIYEDPRFGWGNQWMRHVDALRYARGSVEEVLGQMFEQKT